jgi:integrase/Zn ribbon nucleic-acid-binding protein
MAGLTQQATATDRILGIEACPNSGKSGRTSRSAGASPPCPQCGSQKLFKDGLRYLWDGNAVQRWLCRNCGYRFSHSDLLLLNNKKALGFQQIRSLRPDLNASDMSQHVSIIDTQSLKGEVDILYNRRVRDSAKEAKNLAAAEIKTVAGESPTQQDAKGKILEYAWHLKKRGQAESTIRNRTKALNRLIKKGADLADPDSVETILATEPLTAATKTMYVESYRSFTGAFNIKWIPVKVRYEPKQPFIPLESEIDQLIAACGKRTATFLQVLKDTGARAGEACRLKWTDINAENCTISINNPEKGSRSRTVKVSAKTIAMLNALPKKYGEHIFNPCQCSLQNSFHGTRNKLAVTLQNPRFRQIHFHTMRHFKATMEYKRTRDILHVQRLLGHRSLQNTEIYTHLIEFESDEYGSAAAETVEEAKKLIESGFEYVCDMQDVKLFRKRK